MRKYLHTLPYAAILLLLILGACTQMAADGDARDGKAAPNLTLKTTDDKEIKLADLKGKVVVVDFWATWCPPCRESLPNVAKLSSDSSLAEKGLKVIAIHSQQGYEKAKDYVTRNNLSLTVALDTNGDAEQAFKIQGFPTTIVIGRDGTIQHVIEGFGGKATEEELQTAIDKALAAK